jgi:hypothetical protein
MHIADLYVDTAFSETTKLYFCRWGHTRRMFRALNQSRSQGFENLAFCRKLTWTIKILTRHNIFARREKACIVAIYDEF